MKTQVVLLLTLASALTLPLTVPLTAHAQSKPAHVVSVKKTAAKMYECSICHHKVNAAKAKSLHYICPDDGGKLVPVKPTSLPKSP